MKAHVRLTLSCPLTEKQTEECLRLGELADPEGADYGAAMKLIESYVADDPVSFLDSANVLDVEASA